MADIFNSTNNLYWVFTSYGRSRLASLANEDYLFLYTACIGNYDWYTDENHLLGDAGYSEGAFRRYFEADGNHSLGSPIANGTLPINNKALDEENNIVTLSFTVPEDLNGFDIREIGIYETVNGIDHLFAVCTMQPLPKPSTETNHFIAVQFNCRLQSEALTNHYDQIILDPNNNFVTVEEFTQMQENVLFVESNLAEQISNNARIIGYDRPQQLYEMMYEDKKRYSNFAMSTTYANFLNATSLDKVRCFWVFQPNNDSTRLVSISDLSSYGLNLSTNRLSTQYDTDYEGLATWLNFEYDANSNTGDYFSMDSDIDFDLIETNGEEISDAHFTLFFICAQNSNTHDCTIIAKDNSAQNAPTPPAFNVTITQKRQISLKLYTDKNNYVEYLTGENTVPEAGEFYVASITYDPVMNVQDNILIPRFSVMINGKEVTGSIIRTGNYQGMVKTTLPLTSRTRTLTDYTNYVDSKMCLISLVKETLSPDYIRATVYNMMALIGVNPCLIK